MAWSNVGLAAVLHEVVCAAAASSPGTYAAARPSTAARRRLCMQSRSTKRKWSAAAMPSTLGTRVGGGCRREGGWGGGWQRGGRRWVAARGQGACWAHRDGRRGTGRQGQRLFEARRALGMFEWGNWNMDLVKLMGKDGENEGSGIDVRSGDI